MNYFNKKRKYLMNSKSNGYIKDGLQLWLDGIDNTRNGHTFSSLSVWEDLSGNTYDFEFIHGSPALPSANYLDFSSLKVYRCTNASLIDLLCGVKERTIEIVCEIDDSNTTAKTILMGGNSESASAGVGMWYRPSSNGMCTASASSKTQIISDITNPHTYTAVFDNVSLNNTKFYQDNALCSTTSGGTMANNNFVTLGGRYYQNNYLNYRFVGKIYCVRVYDRQLTQEEREHNRRIDKERFGI